MEFDPVMQYKFAVLGNPIKHSLSPVIHIEFARQFNIDLVYDKILIDINSTTNEIEHYFSLLGSEYQGFNITSPFKETAYKIIKNCDAKANYAKAINTIVFRNNEGLLGFNTDGYGFIKDLTSNKQIAISGKRILLLGAGGAAKGILFDIINQDPLCVTITNRNLDRANELVNDTKKFEQNFKQKFNQVTNFNRINVLSYDVVNLNEYDLIINATSAGSVGAIPPLKEGINLNNTCCYDLSYGVNSIPFVKWARNNNCTLVFQGIGMLIEQGALAFKIWFNKTPITKDIISKLEVMD